MNYRVIKENNLFLTTDKDGDIPAGDSTGLGLYTSDTRFLSTLDIRMNGRKLLLLSSSGEENYISTIRLTNPHMEEEGQLVLWRESIEVERTRFIYEGGLYESFRLTSFAPKPISFDFSVYIDADFADMFVVRGYVHGELGSKTGDMTDGRTRTISYLGADGIQRQTKIQWSKEPSRTSDSGEQHYEVTLAHQETCEIAYFIAPVIDGAGPVPYEPAEARVRLSQSYAEWKEQSTEVHSDDQLFNQLYERGLGDLRVLLTDLGYGRFPVAGLPWFAVPFGRDSLIAALQMLSASPSIAKGTLRTMAAFQGREVNEWRDEQPGKIMHEIRYGELARTNQIPFTPYYGTIDATPLFLLLAAEYVHWTGDFALLQELLPSLEGAIAWVQEHGDLDGDFFVEYDRKSEKGIANQGWKDSADSIVHRSGDYAQAPIALVEVQGYVYQAFKRLAPLLCSLGLVELAQQLEYHAGQLKERFEQSFWMEEEQYYAIALDKDKRQVESVTSNPGHILMSGLAAPERAEAIAKRLVAPDMFSGYGIRTMSTEVSGYNPMSYHDGSVWPHDNSLSVIGLAGAGFGQEAVTVMQGLMKAAAKFEYGRLPELFCGYPDDLDYPVPYPVACSPQAWAAGTPLTFVQALLAIQTDGIAKQVHLKPALLPSMSELTVQRLQLGSGSLTLHLTRGDGGAVKVTVMANTTGYELVIAGQLEETSRQ
ncbi:glycogen debranching N-terminal domain-containing protein [Paenibacillus sp. GCM10023252]|uniref:amylo-alpha-1,6-glucosidase n=1 Tax=Paenibacillus sp. GCM10023252 TaxID=3252649 RepID=UPI003608FB9B